MRPPAHYTGLRSGPTQSEAAEDKVRLIIETTKANQQGCGGNELPSGKFNVIQSTLRTRANDLYQPRRG